MVILISTKTKRQWYGTENVWELKWKAIIIVIINNNKKWKVVLLVN